MTATAWLLVHLVASAALAGLAWTVQVVVYPAFALVGPAEWGRYHARHTRAITRVVAVPWAAQGLSAAALLLDPPARGGLPAAAGLALLALVGVLVTVVAAVPAHERLAGGYRGAQLRTLLRANLARALVWTASTGTAAVLLG